MVRSGGVIVYPTDSSYALGCHLDEKGAMERIARLRRIDKNHNFTLVCRDLSEISTYAKVDNRAFRMMKTLTPGPYTFILPATHEVPRRLQNPRRKTIGLRVPDNPIARALLDILGEPLVSATLIMPDRELPETDPEQIEALIGKQVELVLDGGNCGLEPTTVLDLLEDVPVVLRRGKGSTDFLEE